MLEGLRARCRSAAIVLLLAASVPAAAHAAPVDFKTRSAARKLGVDGIRLFKQRKYEEALDKFDRANKLNPAPTLQLRAAQCLEKLGRLVEASERYLEVSRFELTARSPWQYRKAVKAAREARQDLLPRIPTLTIQIEGPRGDDLKVLLDNRAVPSELVNEAQPVDPGEHEVRVRRPDVTVTEKAKVRESRRATVTIQLPPLPEVKKPEKDPTESENFKWAMVGFGVGAGGLLAAVINGSAAVALESDLAERCPARNCPPDAHGDADAYDATRYATTIGFVLTGLGAAAGTTFLLLPEGDDEAPDSARVTPYVGVGQVGLKGRW